MDRQRETSFRNDVSAQQRISIAWQRTVSTGRTDSARSLEQFQVIRSTVHLGGEYIRHQPPTHARSDVQIGSPVAQYDYKVISAQGRLKKPELTCR